MLPMWPHDVTVELDALSDRAASHEKELLRTKERGASRPIHILFIIPFSIHATLFLFQVCQQLLGIESIFLPFLCR